MESNCNEVSEPLHCCSCDACVDVRCAGYRVEAPRIACSVTRCVLVAMLMCRAGFKHAVKYAIFFFFCDFN